MNWENLFYVLFSALSKNKNNVKASYCLVSSMYMLYNFDEALNILPGVLAKHPKVS